MKNFLTWFRKHILRKVADGRHRTEELSTMQKIVGQKTPANAAVGTVSMTALAEISKAAEKSDVVLAYKEVAPSNKYQPIVIKNASTPAVEAPKPVERIDYRPRHTSYTPVQLAVAESEVEAATLALRDAASPVVPETYADYKAKGLTA